MCKSYSHFISKKICDYAIFNDQNFNDTLTNDIVSFEQLGPGGSGVGYYVCGLVAARCGTFIMFLFSLLFYCCVTWILSSIVITLLEKRDLVFSISLLCGVSTVSHGMCVICVVRK